MQWNLPNYIIDIISKTRRRTKFSISFPDITVHQVTEILNLKKYLLTWYRKKIYSVTILTLNIIFKKIPKGLCHIHMLVRYVSLNIYLKSQPYCQRLNATQWMTASNVPAQFLFVLGDCFGLDIGYWRWTYCFRKTLQRQADLKDKYYDTSQYLNKITVIIQASEKVIC